MVKFLPPDRKGLEKSKKLLFCDPQIFTIVGLTVTRLKLVQYAIMQNGK